MKVKQSRKTQMDSFKDTRLSDEEVKKLNVTYIISVARKLGCSIFLLPEDILEVNPKMMLILTASIMYWILLQKAKVNGEDISPEEEGNAAMDDDANQDGVTEEKEEMTENNVE
ncbi:hypothetical protein R6Q59_025077 [Mikania micrantha]